MGNVERSRLEALELSRQYYDGADRLEERLNMLLDIIKSKPEPSVLADLEKRAAVLRAEIWEQRETAGRLLKAGSKPPLTPSLAARAKAQRAMI